MATRRARPGDETALADVLHSTAIHLLRLLRREDDRWGLSAPRLSLMSVLVFAGPRTVGELAAAEQVRPPTITRLVQALERDGLVRRDADVEDGRLVRISATARGRRLLHAGRARRVRALAMRLGSLTRTDRGAIARALVLLQRILHEP